MVARSGKGWSLAPSLGQLVDEVDKKWPKRSKASDGSIGDTAHAERTSDHNPFLGVVHAVDITSEGIDKQTLIAAAIADSRTKYVISDKRIWQNGRYYKSGGWYPYTGSNPHIKHTHISVTPEGANILGTWFPVVQATPVKSNPTTPAEALFSMATLIQQTGGSGAAGNGKDWGEVTLCSPETGVFYHLNPTQRDSMVMAGYKVYIVNQAAYDQLRGLAQAVAADQGAKGKVITG